jgi:tetratricopeptide (TPR) repeat protein
VGGSDGLGDGTGLRVFLSYTSELRNFPSGNGRSYVAEAERAISAAGHVIVDMADFPAADQPAAQLCVERVRGCQVYVGLLGTRYGSPVRDKPEVSYTELEFDAATEAGLPRLMFLLDTAAVDVGIPVAELIDLKFGTRQEAVRRRVKESGLVTQSFASPDELGRLVERSLHELAVIRQGFGPLPLGSVLRVRNIPARNPGFTGREGLLAEVHDRLLAGNRAVVQALQGMGGVGKTQLAIEYAHRFAEAYDVAWWISVEQAGLIGDQFATLGTTLGCVQTSASTEAVRAAVLADLHKRRRWLLIFDNAEKPADLAGWLPGGGGHVLITSREWAWAEIAAPVEVDVLARDESVAILRGRVTELGASDADRLAAQLGDLPLALAQAAGFMAETGMPAAQYLSLLQSQAGRLLDQAAPGSSYPQSLAAATRLAADRLENNDPIAAQVASVCAFLGPEPIPEDLFTGSAQTLPGQLAACVADPLAWRQTIAHLTRQSLTRIEQHGLVMHRLTQAILRDRLTTEQAAASRAIAEEILADSDPGDPANPVTWPRWAELMPHLLAADLGATQSPALRQMACRAGYYLVARGDIRIGHDLTSRLRQQWRDRFGDDHQHVLAIALPLSWALRMMGHYAEARDLGQETLGRERRILGEDHPSTLMSGNYLAAALRDLGDLHAARDLAQDILDRRRRVLGENDPETLISAYNLAAILRGLGEYQAARDLNEDTLDRKRRVLGENYPSTLTTAHNLAVDLQDLDELLAARDLARDTLDRRTRVLGEDHPDTLRTASSLAAIMRDLGEVQAARDLEQDALNRRRRVLGEDHPDTNRSASNLASDLRALGEGGSGP